MGLHLDHALAWAHVGEAWGLSASGLSVDLGSGAGVPGLVLANSWAGSRWVLLESSTRRAAWLERAVLQLGVGARVRVLCERAEVAGRGPLRGAVDQVVARSFGPPGVTAECAAPLLRVGGHLVVAEPPPVGPSDEEGATRWPAQPLATLGLATGRRTELPISLQELVQVELCPEAYPRKVGQPAKRPLF